MKCIVKLMLMCIYTYNYIATLLPAYIARRRRVKTLANSAV